MSDSASGWYPDPKVPGQFRFWDGDAWTEQTQVVVQQEVVQAGNTLSIIGIVLGVLALVFIPPLTGGVGLVLGIIARKRGERLGMIAIDVAIGGIVLGLVIGFAIGLRLLHTTGG